MNIFLSIRVKNSWVWLDKKKLCEMPPRPCGCNCFSISILAIAQERDMELLRPFVGYASTITRDVRLVPAICGMDG